MSSSRIRPYKLHIQTHVQSILLWLWQGKSDKAQMPNLQAQTWGKQGEGPIQLKGLVPKIVADDTVYKFSSNTVKTAQFDKNEIVEPETVPIFNLQARKIKILKSIHQL